MTYAGARWTDLVGWFASLLIHAVTLGAAIVLTADFSPVPRPRPFQWDVSLVMSPPPESVTSDLPSPSHTSPISPSVAADNQVAKSNVARQAYSPDDTTEGPGSKTNGTAPTSPLQAEEVETADLVNRDSLPQEPAVSSTHPEPDTQDISSSEGEPGIADDDADRTPTHPASLPVLRTGPDELPSPDVDALAEIAAVSEPAIQEPDRLAYRPTPQFHDPIVSRTLHADYGWLANVLFAKVEQIKRYPYLAKNNRWQGNVVLQAVITEDGRVIDIKVVESSGHAMLDRDAITLLEQVSPIRLEHPLGQPQVVVQIPIGYRLE